MESVLFKNESKTPLPRALYVNQPHKTFGSHINKDLVEEWKRELEAWKKENFYDELKNLVDTNKVSGAFYHSIPYYKSTDLDIGDMIDYSSRITTWSITPNKFDNDISSEIILKLESNDIIGLKLQDNQIMLSECHLKITDKIQKDGYDMIIVEINNQ